VNLSASNAQIVFSGVVNLFLPSKFPQLILMNLLKSSARLR
jgi:hypothetical protein